MLNDVNIPTFMYETDSIEKDAKLILSELDPYINLIKSTPLPENNLALELIPRSIIVKQFESLEAILLLVQNKKGFAASPLLRSSCEEVIWLKYLTGLDNETANHLLNCQIKMELRNQLKAQYDFSGKESLIQLGLIAHYTSYSSKATQINEEIKKIGIQLDWDKNAIKNGKLPSISFLAKKTSLSDLYNFLYHATSRYVHFSTMELMRRAWSKNKKVTITSNFLNNYWGSFCIFWSIYLFFETYNASQKYLPSIAEGSIEKILIISKRIGKDGAVPIITAEELFWE